MKTFEGYVQADYSPENWIVLLNIKVEGDIDIDNATSVADVMTALNNAQAAMAAINTLLDDAKAAAHASLNAAFAVYPQADYSPDNWTIFSELKTAGDTAIETASDLAEVEAAQSAAAAEMDGVQTIAQTLAAAKSAAHDALAAAFAIYSESDYTVDAWAVLNGFKSTGDAAIDKASDLAEVEAAQSAAATEMDGVQTIAQTLAAAKSAAHDVLAAAFRTSQGNDPVDDSTALHEFEVTGDIETVAVAEIDQIEEAPTLDSPTIANGTEIVDTDTENDALTASQEIPATNNSTPNAAEELADLEPALESIALDTTN